MQEVGKVSKDLKKDTKISTIDENNIVDLQILPFAKMIQNDGTVIFPTETVYGLGANALSPIAANSIYAAKGRPSDNPLLVHICKFDQIYDIAKDVPQDAIVLAKKFWPGPLTMVLPKKDIVPYQTTGNLDTVAIRMPKNDIALKLIELANLPIAAPSANISGKPSPTKKEHLKPMEGKVDGIILGADCDFGVESTIVDLTGKDICILRPGVITKDMLEKALGKKVVVDKGILDTKENVVAKAPGMKYKHYSPDANVYIVKGSIYSKKLEKIIQDDLKKGLNVCVCGMNIQKDKFACKTIDLGKNKKEVAKNLFASLIELDNDNIDVAYFQDFGKDGIGFAISNRLKKAAGHKYI